MPALIDCRSCNRLREHAGRGLCRQCLHREDSRRRYEAAALRTCQHCGNGNGTRPRGLCWRCHANHAIREQHRSTSKYANRGTGNGWNIEAPLPVEPTDAAPGSDAKIAVMAARVEQRCSLHHPRDAGAFDCRDVWQPIVWKLTLSRWAKPRERIELDTR